MAPGIGSRYERAGRGPEMSPPVIRPLDPPQRPLDAARRAASLPYTLWLDSALRDPEIGRFSFLAVDPFLVLRSRRGEAELLDREGWRRSGRSPLAELERLSHRFRLDAPADGPAFQGGAAGYFGYELGRQLERLPRSRWRDPELPEMELGFYDVVLGWDHVDGDAWLVSTGRPAGGGEASRRAEDRAREVVAWLRGGPSPEPPLPAAASLDPDAAPPHL